MGTTPDQRLEALGATQAYQMMTVEVLLATYLLAEVLPQVVSLTKLA